MVCYHLHSYSNETSIQFDDWGGVIWQQKIDRRLPSELYVAINLQGIYFVHTTTKVDIKLIIILTCCDHFG
jgi:hypothetical protein